MATAEKKNENFDNDFIRKILNEQDSYKFELSSDSDSDYDNNLNSNSDKNEKNDKNDKNDNHINKLNEQKLKRISSESESESENENEQSKRIKLLPPNLNFEKIEVPDFLKSVSSINPKNNINKKYYFNIDTNNNEKKIENEDQLINHSDNIAIPNRRLNQQELYIHSIKKLQGQKGFVVESGGIPYYNAEKEATKKKNPNELNQQQQKEKRKVKEVGQSSWRNESEKGRWKTKEEMKLRQHYD
eukprot:TRINITY_DN2849_c0_g2_i1.p1 TRINITY_DN2849_c0_g2~~TRINITY_DN2849_c0_g2_i1.p1  ORF type:complete len:253 (-),score=102.14 TRINITY_DN2849_c0_g2_i1:75-806(-)